MKTSDIKALVNDVLAGIPKPYCEDIIDEVFFVIESNPHLHDKYMSLCLIHTKTVVNNWGGYWIANAIEKAGERQVSSKKSSLIGSYSLLDADVKVKMRKPKKEEALNLMAEYYQANKSQLPLDIKNYRESIVELLMEGMDPHEAYAMAVRMRLTSPS